PYGPMRSRHGRALFATFFVPPPQPARASATARSASPTRMRRTLPADGAAKKEDQVRRALAEPAHQVRIPLGPERRRDEHLEPASDEVELQLRAHAVEQLELEALAWEIVFCREPDRVLDQRLVVRRDRSVPA